MNTEPIRRRSNGTIDIDFYRQRALSERAAMMTAAGRSIGGVVRTVIGGIRRRVLTVPRSRPLPDCGAMMLIAQAATKRSPI